MARAGKPRVRLGTQYLDANRLYPGEMNELKGAILKELRRQQGQCIEDLHTSCGRCHVTLGKALFQLEKKTRQIERRKEGRNIRYYTREYLRQQEPVTAK